MTTDTDDDLPAHSILGASGAERWMECAGSVELLKRLDLPPSDEKDFQRDGTAGHEGAAHVLATGTDAWEIAGEKFNGVEMTQNFVDAIQEYVDRVRPSMQGFHGKDFFIETRLARPLVHPSMFGTADFGAHVTGPVATKILDDAGINYKDHGFLDITDLKMGEGITVEAVDNKQMKYYGFMFLDQHFSDLPDATPVRLTIAQPRAFHQEGPIREWWTTAGTIRAWVKDELVPAMNATAFETDLNVGPWCRFCPAKLVCPMLNAAFGGAYKADPKLVLKLDPERLGREYNMIAGVKFYIKALEETSYAVLMKGVGVPGVKLVPKKANRIWTESTVDAKTKKVIVTRDAIKAKFGDKAFTEPELKSPAQISELGSVAKDFVKEFAYTPNTGLTVAREDDNRLGVKVEQTKNVFADDVKRLLMEEHNDQTST